MVRPARFGWAPAANTLMRSRYSAHVLGLKTYLKVSWQPDTRPAMRELGSTPPLPWLRLAIKSHKSLGDYTPRWNSWHITS